MSTRATTTGALRRHLQAVFCLGILTLSGQVLRAAIKPVIWSAAINSPTNLITIIGQHFAPASGAPVVTLDSVQLTLFDWSNTTILASTPVGLGPGTYALTVSNGTIATFEVANDPRFGTNTTLGVAGNGATCTLGQVSLYAGSVVNGIPAQGQLLLISSNTALFSLLGTIYGGDGVTTFALPDLRSVAPNGLTYAICDQGVFPSGR